MQPAKNLPEGAFFSAEEKVQLLSGNCPRNVTKERLKECRLSFLCGRERRKMVVDGPKQRRQSYLKGIKILKDCIIFCHIQLLPLLKRNFEA